MRFPLPYPLAPVRARGPRPRARYGHVGLIETRSYWQRVNRWTNAGGPPSRTDYGRSVEPNEIFEFRYDYSCARNDVVSVDEDCACDAETSDVYTIVYRFLTPQQIEDML